MEALACSVEAGPTGLALEQVLKVDPAERPFCVSRQERFVVVV